MLVGDQIRILDLLPYGVDGDECPIECELRIVALSDHPEFEALSYCWGTNNNIQHVKISGNYRGITANLHAALRRLRLQNEKRQLWVDQLCIDQANTEEKMRQVRMMSQIYSVCRSCIIWLGELERDTAELAEASAAIELIEWIPNTGAELSWALTVENFQKAARGVHSMAPECHPWWQRIWTYQEAVLSPQKTILWGPLVLRWESLNRATRARLDGTHPTAFEHYRSLLWCPLTVFGKFSCLDNLVVSSHWINTVKSDGPPQDLLMMMIKTRSRIASKPHDKVFGLLGLVSSQEAPNIHNCDYSTTVAQVYTAATLDMILARGLLPLLIDPRISGGKGTADMPRWAVDFGGQPDHAANPLYLLQAYSRYNACGGRALDTEVFQQAITEEPIRHRALGLKGILVDTVTIVANDRLLRPETQNFDTAIPSILQVWLALARSHLGQQPRCLPDNELDEAFARLVLGDFIRNKGLWVHRRPNPNDLQRVLDVISRKYPWTDQHDIWPTNKCLYSQFCNQAFFITEGGLMGLGHLETEPGDEVWIFNGGNFPFTVRKRDDPSEFDFVGRSYVQGIMHGEAFKGEDAETRMRTIRLY